MVPAAIALVPLIVGAAAFRPPTNGEDPSAALALYSIAASFYWVLQLIVGLRKIFDYLEIERYGPWQWQGSTVRCLNDGNVIRNGLLRGLRKAERTNIYADVRH